MSSTIFFLKYTIYPVLGPVDPKDLGPTFTHEHVSMEFEFSYRAPRDEEFEMITCPWTLQNSGWIQQWP